MNISYSYGDTITTNYPQPREASDFDAFVDEILKLPRARNARDRSYICGPLRLNGDGLVHRCKDDLLPRRWIAKDLDGGDPDEVAILLMRLSDYQAVAWTTLRHSPQTPRLRIVLALDREIDRSEGRRLGAAFVGVLGAGLDTLKWDPSTDNGEQACFLPMAGAEVMQYHGDPVDVDSVLALAPGETPLERPGRAEGVKVFEGDRNKHLFSKGCLMRYGGFDKEAILAALLVENQTTCSPALEKEEVEKIAASAARYAPGADAPPNSREAEDVDSEHHGETSAAQNPLPPLDAQQRALADLDSLALHPRCLVQNYLYADPGTLIAPGGTGKTTQLLYESIHIVLGMPLYGLKVVSPGPVVILTAEDSADVLYARLREIMSGLGLSDDQKNKVLASVYIADLCGQDLRLVWRKDGTIKPTALADHIIERYGPISPAVITIDPTVNFGAGEQQYSNDDAQALLTAARRIVRALQCCVRYVHHTGKQNAKEWALDQYAGRGGSALPDGCRMVAVMQPWCPETEVPLPLGVTHGPGESVMVLARPKGSYHPLQPNIWITRRGWAFFHTIEGPPDKEAEKAALATQVEQFLTVELQAGRYHTQNSLQAQGLLKRDPLRCAVSDLTASGRVVYAKMPKGRTGHGGIREYLHPLKFGAPLSDGAASEKEPEPDDLLRRGNPNLGGAPSYRDREFGAPRCADSLPPSLCCAGVPPRTNGAPSAPRSERRQEGEVDEVGVSGSGGSREGTESDGGLGIADEGSPDPAHTCTIAT